MFERLKRLFAPKERGPDVETVERPSTDGPIDLPVGPMVSGTPPVVPVETPADEQPDEPQR
jgi:hypothetical protein